MLNDIAKSLSCNNAMNMAFSFIQTGLKNLNQALQDRTKEAKSLQVTVEKMKGNDCRSGLAKLKIQMADGNMKITKLEEELQRMKEENKDLLFEIQQLQIPQVQKATVSAPQSVGQGEPVLKNQLGQRDQENEPAPREEQTAFSVDESSDEVPQHIEVADNVGNLEEHVEKNGPDLLQNFQTVVMDLIAVCSESQPENKDEQCQKLDSDPRVKLYYTLQNTIRHCFNGLINKVEETISEKTVETLLGEESPFSEKSIKKAPGDMLRPISEEIQKHDQTVTDAGNNLQAPFQQDQSAEMQENSHSLVSDEVKSINEMAKRQTCNRGVTLESLQEIDLTMAPRNKGSAQEEPLCRSPEVTVSNSDNVPLLSSQKKKTKITSAKQTVEVEPEPQSGYTFLQNPENITLQNDDPVHLVDVVERYAMDMEEEGETLLRTKMRGIKFVINVQSQRSNLRILHLAFVNKRISSKLYSLVKHCVINTLDSVKLRLVCLFNRYVARDALQRVRRTLDAQLRLARGMTNGKTIKDLYCFLQRIDHFQHAVISKWSDRQISIDQRRRRCIAQMIYLFQQIREDYGLHLAMPYPCQSYKSLPFLCVMPMSLNLSFIQGPTPVPPRSTHHPSPLSDLRYGHVLSRVDSQDQVEDAERGKRGWVTRWPVNKTLSSGEADTALPQLTCHLPRLFEMDVNYKRIKALHTLQTRTAGANHQMSLGRADLMKKN
ncbi:protein FAM186B-like [Hoplias malabaricus]|uniref:protein FAM186B-like n=1 Tax=Hoplias malabaricus TaxID=27720 RepID=UPI0034621D69